MTTTEAKIEQDFIAKLQEQKYHYRDDIRDRDALEQNFRTKFEELNRVSLSDGEFDRLLEQIITPDVYLNAQHLREINTFERDDGTPLHYTLVNIKDWCKNSFEVINQLRMNTRNSHHRYDVLLLINGVPVVQVELKALAITPRRAMQQIVEYKHDPENGYTKSLLCFVQLFIVSNRTDTWYFVNNNLRHFAFDADERFLPLYQFADPDNAKITHLDDFSQVFLTKCTLGKMISRYMVLVASEQKLLIMRPYQIYAVQNIVDCIHQNRGNGYIWHTTGSGKTLTSFKASTLLKDNPDVDKCLFVVDRKDLDRQTREEFNKFQEGCVEENTNTGTLVERLRSDDYADKVIVTTIQKLGLALDDASKKPAKKGTGKHKKRPNYRQMLEPLRDKRIVFIFDECHRSQFGENHQAIKSFFPNAQLFGFTGTPIFEDNASIKQIDGEEQTMKTTEDVFEKELHKYTITHAIEDRNVLRFHVDYFQGEGADANRVSEADSKMAVVDAILDKHRAATHGCKFNAIFATASISDAIDYYKCFDVAQSDRKGTQENYQPLNIACVFSPPAEGKKRQDIKQLQADLEQESAEYTISTNENAERKKEEIKRKKKALKKIIAHYNASYNTNHSINEFDDYYKDVQKRIKDQQYPLADLKQDDNNAEQHTIDITIVVDMLLTGFDSKYLNTLYVDKKLKYHGLIQAFSRTNRVLNDTKPYGNILDFRGQSEAVNTAIALFSGEQGDKAKEIWLVEAAPKVVDKLAKAVDDLKTFMEQQGVDCAPEQVANLKGDNAKIGFVQRFKDIQRLKTQLDQYTDLSLEDTAKIDELIPPDTLQAFRGVYLGVAQKLKDEQEKHSDHEQEDELQQLDFEFVLFASSVIDYDYIMSVIAKYSSAAPEKQKMNREELISLIHADAKFLGEREEIEAYIHTLKAGEGLSEEAIREGFEHFKKQRFTAEVVEIAENHGLCVNSLQVFITRIMERMIFDGEQLSELMEPLDLGWKERQGKEEALMTELLPFLRKLAAGREISGLAAYE